MSAEHDAANIVTGILHAAAQTAISAAVTAIGLEEPQDGPWNAEATKYLRLAAWAKVVAANEAELGNYQAFIDTLMGRTDDPERAAQVVRLPATLWRFREDPDLAETIDREIRSTALQHIEAAALIKR